MVGAGLATAPDSSAAARLLDLAEDFRLAGDYQAGSAAARQAAALAAETGDPGVQATALHSLANQLMRLGELEEAVAASREAIAVLECTGDQASICQALTVQALPLNDLGMHEEALEVLAQAREIAQRLGDRSLLYWVHNRTGVVHGSMGNRALSWDYLMRALTMAEGMDTEARFCILNNLGDNAVYEVARLRAEGEPERAQQMLTSALGYVDDALSLAREAGNPFRQAICLDNYGMLLALGGNFDDAVELVEQARVLAARNRYSSVESSTLHHQARIREMRGDHRGAIKGFLEALQLAEAAGEKPVLMEIHLELSNTYETVGDTKSALAHYRVFHTLERESHNDVAAVRVRMAGQAFELDNARHEVELHRERSAELERQAGEDPLTGLPNRRYAERALDELAKRPLCVALADADHFKGVNDRFGHFVGDEVLRQIAAILRESVRGDDFVARFGGEEFLIALGGAGIEDATARCEALRARVAAYPWHEIEPDLRVTISIGVATVAAGRELPQAMTTADERLYTAKRTGRNRVVAD
jgi:diguanylate cyclase